MINALFFASPTALFIAAASEFDGPAFKKEAAKKAAWIRSPGGFTPLPAWIADRKIAAARPPFSNRSGFARGASLPHTVLRLRMKQGWISAVLLPALKSARSELHCHAQV